MQRVLRTAFRGKRTLPINWIAYTFRCSSTISSPSSVDTDTPQYTVPIEGTSKEHNDLPSFLAYASRVRLRPTNPTYVGTHYEYTVASSLRRLGFSLTRVGGRSDLGIDLLGDWTLPAFDSPLKVIVQCKAINRVLSPNAVRELEGTFVGAPAGWRGPDVIGVLTTPKNATKGVYDALGRSKLPLCFIMIGLGGRMEQCLWNAAAREKGLEGVDVTLRYTPERKAEVEAMTKLGINTHAVSREIALTQNGKILSTEIEGDTQA
ncbi:MAG: hypothetical protein M1812_004011 [Candelaria pacifica]|nr:MAG: hypothetical protein M1812_004011 [Candelaria pacifica]